MTWIKITKKCFFKQENLYKIWKLYTHNIELELLQQADISVMPFLNTDYKPGAFL